VTADYEQWPDPQVSIGSKKDGAALTLIETDNGVPGAWCPTCHTTWLQTDEVSMKDLDDA
jgi:hypothetical protein